MAGVHDIVVATKPITAESWTHIAFTRDGEGVFRLYLNGELDATSAVKEARRFEKLTPFRSNVAGGTAGDFAEFRVWKVCRTADEIRALLTKTGFVEVRREDAPKALSDRNQDLGMMAHRMFILARVPAATVTVRRGPSTRSRPIMARPSRVCSKPARNCSPNFRWA